MKKLMIAIVAGFMSLAVAGAYAADEMKKDKMDKSKGDMMKSDKGMTKSEKGMAKSEEAMSKDDMKKKGESSK